MTVVVTHSTPADGSFSTEGATAWNADHTLSGVGTLAEQDANAVAITGGTIDNTVIGSTTPNAATFTTLTATGQTSLGGAAGSESLRVVTTASANRYVQAQGGVSGASAAAIGTGGGSGTFDIFASGGSGIRLSTNGAATAEQLRVANTSSAVNYVQVTGAATGAPSQPIISAQGSDANINIALQGKGTGAAVLLDSGGGGTLRAIPRATGGDTFLDVRRDIGGVSLLASSSVTNGSVNLISKGTGAIDLAAGSSGVNISNGGTVTAITRTAQGTTYTSAPTVAVSAPTTAGGVQATVSAYLRVFGETLTSGGTGYTVNDIITFVGGTGISTASYRVTSVSAGVITGISLNTAGGYTTVPSNPISVTGGTGTGATITVTNWGVDSVFTITNAGSGYVEQPTVTFSGGGGSGAAAYATVGSGTVVKSIGSSLDFYTPAGRSFQVLNSPNANPVNFLQVSPNNTGQPAYLAVNGSDTNASMWFFSKGTGSIDSWTGGGRQFLVANTASAVNYVQVTGAATGSGPIISAQGSDANAGLVVRSKGTGVLFLETQTGSDVRIQPRGVRSFSVNGVSSGVNYGYVTGSVAGSSPIFGSEGTDTNIDLALTPKGTGKVRFGTYTGTILTPTGYVEIKDAGGTIRRLLVG